MLVKRLGAASVRLLPAAQLALYGAGLDGDALVVQVGYGETSVLPVASNVPLVHSAVIAKLGTCDLLLCLHSLALEVTTWLTPSGGPRMCVCVYVCLRVFNVCVCVCVCVCVFVCLCPCLLGWFAEKVHATVSLPAGARYRAPPWC